MEKRTTRIVVAGLFLYFLDFAIPALRARWATDDPMNLRYYRARDSGARCHPEAQWAAALIAGRTLTFFAIPAWRLIGPAFLQG